MGINEKALRIKEKFEGLGLKQRSVINYNNLYNTIIWMLGQLGYEPEKIFYERCLIKSNVNIDDIELHKAIQFYWTFIQIDRRIINTNMYNFDLVIKRKNWGIISKAELLYMITISRYGYYLDLSEVNMQNLDEEEIARALDKLEDNINEV